MGGTTGLNPGASVRTKQQISCTWTVSTRSGYCTRCTILSRIVRSWSSLEVSDISASVVRSVSAPSRKEGTCRYRPDGPDVHLSWTGVHTRVGTRGVVGHRWANHFVLVVSSSFDRTPYPLVSDARDHGPLGRITDLDLKGTLDSRDRTSTREGLWDRRDRTHSTSTFRTESGAVCLEPFPVPESRTSSAVWNVPSSYGNLPKRFCLTVPKRDTVSRTIHKPFTPILIVVTDSLCVQIILLLCYLTLVHFWFFEMYLYNKNNDGKLLPSRWLVKMQCCVTSDEVL